MGPLQASGADDARLSSETNLGKPTDKQKKKCFGEEWAPYWTQTRSEFMVKFLLAGRCRCEPWLLDKPARIHGFTVGHVACRRGLFNGAHRLADRPFSHCNSTHLHEGNMSSNAILSFAQASSHLSLQEAIRLRTSPAPKFQVFCSPEWRHLIG